MLDRFYYGPEAASYVPVPDSVPQFSRLRLPMSSGYESNSVFLVFRLPIQNILGLLEVTLCLLIILWKKTVVEP